MNKPLQCIICEKELISLFHRVPPCSIKNGGTLSVYIGYGSNYDRGLLFDPVIDENTKTDGDIEGGIPIITKKTKYKKAEWIDRSDLANDVLTNILSCHEVRAFICDECIKKKENLLKGYNVIGEENNGVDIYEEVVFIKKE